LQGRLDRALEHSARSARLFEQRQDQRGVVESTLQKCAILIEAGDWNGAQGELNKLPTDNSVSTEQQALRLLRDAQIAVAQERFDAARAALQESAAAAEAAHSQPITIQVELLKARIAQLQNDPKEATVALQRARNNLLRFAPHALSLLVAETALELGDASQYEHAISLLRRSPDYVRAYALHHAASRALRQSGQPKAADEARQRWLESRNTVRETLSPALRISFDALPQAQEPSA
jgi:tetratricopeptide (TPR) repeat protein